MKLIGFVLIAGVAFGVYWFMVRPGCGRSGAIACPAAELEEGVGVTLSAAEACRGAGYLCAERRSFQVVRWPLDKGKLRVRMRLPEFADERTARELRDAAIEGIMEWDGHPFPIVIDNERFTVHMWDVGVVWSQGLFSERAGQALTGGYANGKRMEFRVEGLAVVVPPIRAKGAVAAIMPSSDPATMMAQARAMVGEEMGPALLEQVKAVAMHEMGHVLGLMHSDSQDDIMYPEYRRGVTQARASARDLRSVDALYALPNGAMVQQP